MFDEKFVDALAAQLAPSSRSAHARAILRYRAKVPESQPGGRVFVHDSRRSSSNASRQTLPMPEDRVANVH